MELHDKIGFISQIFNLKRSIVGLLIITARWSIKLKKKLNKFNQIGM